MKRNRFVFVGAVAVAVALFLAWWLQKSSIPRQQDQSVQEATKSETSASANTTRANPISSDGPPKGGSNIAAIANEHKQGLMTKAQEVGALLGEENKRPLDLYGRAVDQSGQPVVGATVKGSVLLNADFVNSGGEACYTETDSQGQFRFLGLHGVTLGILLTKQGYVYDPKLLSGRPEDYQSDPNNPVIFKMWKLKGADPMLHARFESRIPYDGTPTSFDPQTGNRVPDSSGELRVTLLRSPQQIPPGLVHPYDWYLKVEILDGGILQDNAPYPYWAPDNGYQPYFEASMSSNAVPWQSTLAQTFYIKDPQGRYGRLFIDLSTNSKRPDTGVTVEAWINPSGSQNLEYDSARGSQ